MSELLTNLTDIYNDKQKNLLPQNLKQNITCLGVTGTLKELKGQTKTVTPTATTQTVMPDTNYNGLTAVTVNGDANLVGENIKSGVTIFNVTGTHECSTGNNGDVPVKLFETEESMQADDDAVHDDLALVYKNNKIPLTESLKIGAISIENTINVEQFTTNVNATWRSSDNNQYLTLNCSSSEIYISVRTSDTSKGFSYTYNTETGLYELSSGEPSIIIFTEVLLFENNFDPVMGEILKINSTTPLTNNSSFNTLYLPLTIPAPENSVDSMAYLYDETDTRVGTIYVSFSKGEDFTYGYVDVYASSVGLSVSYEYDEETNMFTRQGLTVDGTEITDTSVINVTLSSTLKTLPDYRPVFANIITPRDVYFGGLFRYGTHVPGNILTGYKLTEIRSVTDSAYLDVSSTTTNQYRTNWTKIWEGLLQKTTTDDNLKQYTANQTFFGVYVKDNRVHMPLVASSINTSLSAIEYKIPDSMSKDGAINGLCLCNNNTGVATLYDVSIDLFTYETTVDIIVKDVAYENGKPLSFDMGDVSTMYLLGAIRFNNGKIQYTPFTYNKCTINIIYQVSATYWSFRSLYTPAVVNPEITEYMPAYTQLTDVAENEVLPKLTIYGKNGVITGDGSIYGNLDATTVKKDLFGITTTKTQHTKYGMHFPAVGSASSDYQTLYANKLTYWKDNGLLPGETTYFDVSELDTSLRNYTSTERFYNSAKDRFINNSTGTVKIQNDTSTLYTLSELSAKKHIYTDGTYVYSYCKNTTNNTYCLYKINLTDGTYSSVYDSINVTGYSGKEQIYPKVLFNRYICLWHTYVCTTAVNSVYPREDRIYVYDTLNNKGVELVNHTHNSEYKYTSYNSCIISWTDNRIYAKLHAAIPTSSSGGNSGKWVGYCTIPSMAKTAICDNLSSQISWYGAYIYATFGNSISYNNEPYLITSKTTNNYNYGAGDFELIKMAEYNISPSDVRYVARINWTETFPKKGEYNLVRLPCDANKYLLVTKENDYKLMVTKCKITLNGHVFTFTPFGPVYNINTAYTYFRWWNKSGGSNDILTYFSTLSGGYSSSGGDFAPEKFNYDSTDDNSLLEATYSNGYTGTVKLRNLKNCENKDADFTYLITGTNCLIIHSDDMTPFVS